VLGQVQEDNIILLFCGMNKERKNIRLSRWDYSYEGVYFTTICCKDRNFFFGKIKENEMILSEIGLITSKYWLEIPYHFPHVKLDEFVVMPNHIHGILILDYSLVGTRHGVSLRSPSGYNVGPCHGMALPARWENCQQINQFSKPVRNSVSVIINQFKSSVKRWCNKNGSNYFQWQSRFYDQILHNEESIDLIREYIGNNPKNWSYDELNN
jgi:putative transposase